MSQPIVLSTAIAQGPSATAPLAQMTDAPVCKADCRIHGGKMGHGLFPIIYTWHEYEPESTFTAATVVTIVNTVQNTTTTSTIHNEIPSGASMPVVNALGTKVAHVGNTWE